MNASNFPDLAGAMTAADLMDQSKSKIIDVIVALRNDDNISIPDAPTLPLHFDNGTVIADSFEHYLGAKAHESTGAFVKLALGNPLDFQWYREYETRELLEKFKDRSYFDLGRFLHMPVLEPDRWDDVIVEPTANRASHDGLDTLITFWENLLFGRGIAFVAQKHEKTADKKTYIDQLKSDSGLTVVTEQHHLIIQQLRNRWVRYADGAWFEILKKAHREVSMYTDDYKGFPMRIRPDGMLFEDQIGLNAIVSVKTTSSPTLNAYRRQCAQLGYHIKEAAYQDIASHITGKKFNTTINIVFQTVEPFNCGVFVWDVQDIEIGSVLFNDAIMEAKELIKSGEYPGWDEVGNEAGLIDVSLPDWARSHAD